MESPIILRNYDPPAVDRREILRYAGCREADAAVNSLLESCLSEAMPTISYHAVMREVPLIYNEGKIRAGALETASASLARHLTGCGSAVIFAATIGTGFDRLLLRYSRISPSRALMLQAIGAERIEALCDEVSAEFPGAKSRFSPGYGDLPLSVQRDFFAMLDCERKLGLCLNESLLMSPSKSVTAIIGLV